MLLLKLKNDFSSIPVKKDPLRGWSDNIANQTQLAARALMKKATKTVNNKNKGINQFLRLKIELTSEVRCGPPPYLKHTGPPGFYFFLCSVYAIDA